jgi:hypothetical protein
MESAPRTIVVTNPPQAAPSICQQTEAPVVEETYPALVVFKAGGMYSATRYWVKNKNLYFVTTEGKSLYAPLGQVDHVYPGKSRAEVR